MCALGPIVPGTSLLVTHSHTPSMFDIDDDWITELDDLTSRAAAGLHDVYGLPIHSTEHGRIGLCGVDSGHDAHCYHAHRLMFAVDLDIASHMATSMIEPITTDGFATARAKGAHLVKYLYHQAPDGTVTVGAEDGDAPRQFFRGIVAEAIGAPALRSWREHPDEDLVAKAATALR